MISESQFLYCTCTFREYITDGEVYPCIFEYDSVYEIINNNGNKHCLPKAFFIEITSDNPLYCPKCKTYYPNENGIDNGKQCQCGSTLTPLSLAKKGGNDE